MENMKIDTQALKELDKKLKPSHVPIKPIRLKWRKGVPDLEDFVENGLCFIFLYGNMYSIRKTKDRWMKGYDPHANKEEPVDPRVLKDITAYCPYVNDWKKVMPSVKA